MPQYSARLIEIAFFAGQTLDQVVQMSGVNDEIQHVGASAHVEYAKKLVEYFFDVDDVQIIAIPRVNERSFRTGNSASGAASCYKPAMDLLSRLLHRDGLMLIIDKPAGVAVHRGPKGGPSLEDGFDQLRFGLPRPPALAHRLDKDTSGCLVLGRHRKALERLGRLFKSGRVGKTYWAVVEGAPAGDQGEIDLALGRLDASRGWWMRPDPLGLPARTSWRVIGRSADGALAFIEFAPHTGRTHQIRVHAQALGWPILGDPIYGSGRREGAPPLHLHARAVSVPMQDGKPPVEALAAPPAHMTAALAACGWRD